MQRLRRWWDPNQDGLVTVALNKGTAACPPKDGQEWAGAAALSPGVTLLTGRT
jgi:hypothetical protein